MQVWKTVRSFGTVADWSAPIGMERITSILLVSQPGTAMQARLKLLQGVSNKDCKDWRSKHGGCSPDCHPLLTLSLLLCSLEAWRDSWAL